MTTPPAEPDADVRAALHALGKHRLVLAIHDASFPGAPDTDLGRGTPYSEAARAFMGFVRRLGFDGIMLGPQGATSRDNPSPYDGTLFSRNPLNIDYASLASDPIWCGFAQAQLLSNLDAVWPSEKPGYATAFHAKARALQSLHEALMAARTRGLDHAAVVDQELARFRAASESWLEGDALYAALSARHGHRHHRDWPPAAQARTLRDELAVPMERHVIGQMVVHRQHAAMRRELRHIGLRLYGDLQVGLSPCDEWQHEHLFLRHYRLGAPPSRTNPEGQPWGYRVFDPDKYRAPDGGPGPVMRFVQRRIGKLLSENDGLRIDHPHGLVCPWVYRADEVDPYQAVRNGARLFSSPCVAGHADLARFAIARAEQLANDDPAPRHADDWVRALDDDQVTRYSELFAVVAAAVRAHGGEHGDVVCEVLSTCPYPLSRVMQRQGLGRFRVTQKARVNDPLDVYRSDNARPEDWIMVGNHDTPPVLKLTREWSGTDEGMDRAAYLARRLGPDERAEPLQREFAASPQRMVQALFADAFASPARHVLVFFADLLGLAGIYNRPGIIHPENWSLRVPVDYERCDVLDLHGILALAVRARGRAFAEAHAGLLARLERGARPQGQRAV